MDDNPYESPPDIEDEHEAAVPPTVKDIVSAIIFGSLVGTTLLSVGLPICLAIAAALWADRDEWERKGFAGCLLAVSVLLNGSVAILWLIWWTKKSRKSGLAIGESRTTLPRSFDQEDGS
jgi:hypothetical protein